MVRALTSELSKVQQEALDGAFHTKAKVQRLEALVRHLLDDTTPDGELRCVSDHCWWCWQAQAERARLAEAKAEVYGFRLALAERALRQSRDVDALNDWRRTASEDLETAIERALKETA